MNGFKVGAGIARNGQHTHIFEIDDNWIYGKYKTHAGSWALLKWGPGGHLYPGHIAETDLLPNAAIYEPIEFRVVVGEYGYLEGLVEKCSHLTGKHVSVRIEVVR